MCRVILVFCFILFSSVAMAEEKNSLYKQLKIEDDIRWLDETPQSPEDYIGQVWLIQRNGESVPYHTPIAVPLKVFEEPTVKKSILVKSQADGSASFLDIVSVKGSDESVYQFQIVDSKKWSANAKDAKYAKAISSFRNDPMSVSIFNDNEYAGVVMCTAIVQKKIWYKSYKKKSWSGSGTYFVKIDGSDYYGSEDYEEIIKYGLLIRPIHGFGYKLPKAILNSAQVETISEKMKIPVDVLNKVNFNVEELGKRFDGKSIAP